MAYKNSPSLNEMLMQIGQSWLQAKQVKEQRNQQALENQQRADEIKRQATERAARYIFDLAKNGVITTDDKIPEPLKALGVNQQALTDMYQKPLYHEWIGSIAPPQQQQAMTDVPYTSNWEQVRNSLVGQPTNILQQAATQLDPNTALSLQLTGANVPTDRMMPAVYKNEPRKPFKTKAEWDAEQDLAKNGNSAYDFRGQILRSYTTGGKPAAIATANAIGDPQLVSYAESLTDKTISQQGQEGTTSRFDRGMQWKKDSAARQLSIRFMGFLNSGRMNPKVATAEGNRLYDKLGIPKNQRPDFASWAASAGQMNPKEARQFLLDQARYNLSETKFGYDVSKDVYDTNEPSKTFFYNGQSIDVLKQLVDNAKQTYQKQLSVYVDPDAPEVQDAAKDLADAIGEYNSAEAEQLKQEDAYKKKFPNPGALPGLPGINSPANPFKLPGVIIRPDGGGKGTGKTTTGSPASSGLITPGNIDLGNRKIINNPDGSYSTVNSYTMESDGKFYVVPGVNGQRKLSGKEAWAQFRRTGKHLGIFGSQEAADTYAQNLHKQQAQQYNGRATKRLTRFTTDTENELLVAARNLAAKGVKRGQFIVTIKKAHPSYNPTELGKIYDARTR